MATPTYAELVKNDAAVLDKIRQCLAIIASGQNPDGSSSSAGGFTDAQFKAATRASVGTQTSVANAMADTQLLAANANRIGATIFNDDTATTGATLRVHLGGVASATAFTVAIAPQGYYEVPYGYTGIIKAIASAATGNARITEFT